MVIATRMESSLIHILDIVGRTCPYLASYSPLSPYMESLPDNTLIWFDNN